MRLIDIEGGSGRAKDAKERDSRLEERKRDRGDRDHDEEHAVQHLARLLSGERLDRDGRSAKRARAVQTSTRHRSGRLTRKVAHGARKDCMNTQGRLRKKNQRTMKGKKNEAKKTIRVELVCNEGRGKYMYECERVDQCSESL